MAKFEKELKIKGRSVSQIKSAKQAQYARLGKMSPNVGRKKCKKGKSCGAACIASFKVCMVDVPNIIAQYIPKVVKSIQDRSKQVKGAESSYKIKEISEKTPKQAAVYPGDMRSASDIEAKYAKRIKSYRDAGKEDLAKREEKQRDSEIARLKQNAAFAEKLVRNVPDGVKVSVKGTGIALEGVTKAGHKIEFAYSGGDLSFKVDKSFGAGKVKGRAAQLEVASMVREMYDSVMRSVPVGTVVWTKVYTEDGKGAKRESALARMGFSQPEFSGDAIFAKKVSADRISKSSEEEFDKYKDDKNSVYFAEGGKVDDEVKGWYQVIFGTDLLED